MIPELMHRCEAMRTAVNAVNALAPGERFMLKTLVDDLCIDLGGLRDDPDADAWWCAAVAVRSALRPSSSPDAWVKAVAAFPAMTGAAVSVPDHFRDSTKMMRPRFTEVHDPVTIAENEGLIGLQSD
jgi:hypothetical protein